MAASDYTITAEGSFTAMGLLGGPMTASPANTTITLTAFRGDAAGDLPIGLGVMIDDEICRIASVAFPEVTLQRGCADTIPAPHAADAQVWFFSDTAISNSREYLATDTVGVKMLPFTAASGPVPVGNAPPLSVTLNWRAFRPYPPGKVLVNGMAFNMGPFAIPEGETQLLFSWAHRDRLLQADQLIDHNADSIGPELGTTYRVRVLSASMAVLRTVEGLTGTTWAYTDAMLAADLGTGNGFVELCSVRETFTSLYSYRIPVTGGTPGVGGGGLGDTLGENLGGSPA